MTSRFEMAGLFAGIGGIELGFANALGDDLNTTMLCEWWEPAKAVLRARFPGVPVEGDVRDIERLPKSVNLVSAGFPCTDLSQAGRMAGIDGVNSGLVRHLFRLLELRERADRPTLLIENVPNMLALDQGHAMRFLVNELETLGYQWAYRVVDSRFTGVPQRRRRVILVASVILIRRRSSSRRIQRNDPPRSSAMMPSGSIGLRGEAGSVGHRTQFRHLRADRR